MLDGMKKVGVLVWLCWMMSLSVRAGDSVLIRMRGKEVNLSEFRWYLHRTLDSGNVDDFLERFVKYQLKVADAEGRQMDTLPNFRKQCTFLQAKVLKKHFVNQQLADSYCREMAAQMESHRVEKEWLRMDVFTFYLSQHVSSTEERNALRVMKEWRHRLQQSVSPSDDDLAWAHANGVTRQLDAATWIPKNHLLKELVHEQSVSKIGCWSELFYSPYGLHVLRVAERRNKVGNEWDSDLRRYLERRIDSLPIFDGKAYRDWERGNYQLPEEVCRELQEIHDGLLAVYWDLNEQKNNSRQRTIPPEALDAYFRKNKSRYNWEFPHFKGAIVHCRSKKSASKIKKQLKKLPMSMWKEALKHMQQSSPNYGGELESGLFQIGTNPYIDYLAFKCGSLPQHEKYPHTFLIGKKLKKGPEEYTDVMTQVTADYRKQHENDRFRQLFASFNVEINKDALKTVNSCGNK